MQHGVHPQAQKLENKAADAEFAAHLEHEEAMALLADEAAEQGKDWQ